MTDTDRSRPLQQWHIRKNGKEHGPYSTAQVKKLMQAGKLSVSDEVRRDGQDQWRPLSSFSSSGPTESSRPRPGDDNPNSFGASRLPEPSDTTELPEAVGSHPLDRLLPVARGIATEGMIAAVDHLIIAVGRWAQWFAVAGVFFYSVAIGVKSDSLRMLFYALFGTAGVVLLQYWSHRATAAFQATLTATPIRMSTSWLVDGMALTFLAAAVVSPVFALVTGFQSNEPAVGTFLTSCVLFIGFGYMTATMLHTSRLGIRIDASTSAGEEALGGLTVLTRLLSQFVPVIYSFFMAVFAVTSLFATIALFQGGEAGLSGLLQGSQAIFAIALVSALPLIAYLYFLAYSLLIDIFRSVVAVPPLLEDMRASLSSDARDPVAAVGDRC